MSVIKKFTDGFAWGEGLRYKDGYLYFSDIYGKTVYRADKDGTKEVMLLPDDMPSGLGFLPDGSLLVVSGGKRQLIKVKDGISEIYCDLSDKCVGINDMVVDDEGNAYVGAYGYQMQYYKGGAAEGWLFHISPDGKISKVCTELLSPNGIIITPDKKTLIVADTFPKKLIAYDLNGGVPQRARVWAELPAGPDGICLDESGAVWAVLPNASMVARIEEGGRITDEIAFEETPLCCTLGGEDRKTLYVVTVPAHKDLSTDDLSNPEKQQKKAASRIYTLSVKVSGAGYP